MQKLKSFTTDTLIFILSFEVFWLLQIKYISSNVKRQFRPLTKRNPLFSGFSKIPYSKIHSDFEVWNFA